MTKQADTQQIVAENIRRFREASGKTKTELCASIGMSRAFWDDVENGTKEPSVSTLERIASALSTTVRELVTEPELAFSQSAVPPAKPKRKRAS
jgi:transcriptional regulator with XRE-family HTH domain